MTTTPSQHENNKHLLWCVVAICVFVVNNAGCHCLGPTSTCLRPDGPILTLQRRLHEQHLQRSQYTRVVPQPYTDLPQLTNSVSRFHPVPSRNVFSAPAEPYQLHEFDPNQMGMPMLMGPGQELMQVHPQDPGQQLAPDQLVPPVYQPEAESSVLEQGTENSSNDMPGYETPGASGLETLPMPAPNQDSRESLPSPLNLDQESDPVVPPELDRPETLNDKVTHRDLIQYPYTLDTERPYSDWVRGIEPSRPPSRTSADPAANKSAGSHGTYEANRMSTRQQVTSPIPSGRSMVQPASFETPEFGPPVYVRPYLTPVPDGDRRTIPTAPASPQKILKRTTSYGPTQPTREIPSQNRVTAAQRMKPNGVPYLPTNDPTHPMFQSSAPYLQLNSAGQTEPVQMHSAFHNRYTGTTIR